MAGIAIALGFIRCRRMQPPASHPSIERCADVISAWIATNLCAPDGILPVEPSRPPRRQADGLRRA